MGRGRWRKTMSKNNIIEEGIKEDMELILIEDLGMGG